MEKMDILISKSVKAFIKGTFVLIGLFFIFSCIVAVLLFPFDRKLDSGKKIEVNKKIEVSENTISENKEISKNSENVNNSNNNNNNKVWSLIFVLTIPFLVLLLFLLTIFLRFACLAKWYYEKINKMLNDKVNNILDRILNEELKKNINNMLIESLNEKTNTQQGIEEKNFIKSKMDKLFDLCCSTVKAIGNSSKDENAVKALKDISDKLIVQLSKMDLTYKCDATGK